VKYPIVTSQSMPIRFNEYLLFLEPCKKVAIRALELDVAKCMIASMWHPMQTCIWFCFSMQVVDTLKNFLNLVLPVAIDANSSTMCLLLLEVQKTKDGLSLSITQKSCSLQLPG